MYRRLLAAPLFGKKETSRFPEARKAGCFCGTRARSQPDLCALLAEVTLEWRGRSVVEREFAQFVLVEDAQGARSEGDGAFLFEMFERANSVRSTHI